MALLSVEASLVRDPRLGDTPLRLQKSNGSSLSPRLPAGFFYAPPAIECVADCSNAFSIPKIDTALSILHQYWQHCDNYDDDNGGHNNNNDHAADRRNSVVPTTP
jgi:hypothetical protein